MMMKFSLLFKITFNSATACQGGNYNLTTHTHSGIYNKYTRKREAFRDEMLCCTKRVGEANEEEGRLII